MSENNGQLHLHRYHGFVHASQLDPRILESPPFPTSPPIISADVFTVDVPAGCDIFQLPCSGRFCPFLYQCRISFCFWCRLQTEVWGLPTRWIEYCNTVTTVICTYTVNRHDNIEISSEILPAGQLARLQLLSVNCTLLTAGYCHNTGMDRVVLVTTIKV